MWQHDDVIVAHLAFPAGADPDNYYWRTLAAVACGPHPPDQNHAFRAGVVWAEAGGYADVSVSGACLEALGAHDPRSSSSPSTRRASTGRSRSTSVSSSWSATRLMPGHA